VSVSACPQVSTRFPLDIVFVVNFLRGWESKSCPPSVYVIGLWVPTLGLRDFPLFHVSPSFKTCQSARCAAAEDSYISDFGVFRRQNYHTKSEDIVCRFVTQGLYFYNARCLNCLTILLFCSGFFLMCPVCSLCYLFVPYAVSVIGHFAVATSRQ
jgi:hypothetical protein